eukprot:TRINITY_DN1127_c0_g5_i1.p2 TRINITY_DN1127_c0_g5~~TRINITY_DN1127_c0_g5_i1.p2  ORF type:complete len:233 (+),score=67.55 TRINITY_DN1127_c0_g5_i1:54-752(+)
MSVTATAPGGEACAVFVDGSDTVGTLLARVQEALGLQLEAAAYEVFATSGAGHESALHHEPEGSHLAEYGVLGAEVAEPWLPALLEEHSTDRWYVEFNTFLSSHLVSGAVGLANLGADEDRTLQWLARYATKLEPAAAHRAHEEEDAAADLTSLRGERRHYYHVLKLYRARLEETYGGDVWRLIRGDFPGLSGGIAAGLLHCIINLGYAVDSGSKGCMLESFSVPPPLTQAA